MKNILLQNFLPGSLHSSQNMCYRMLFLVPFYTFSYSLYPRRIQYYSYPMAREVNGRFLTSFSSNKTCILLAVPGITACKSRHHCRSVSSLKKIIFCNLEGDLSVIWTHINMSLFLYHFNSPGHCSTLCSAYHTIASGSRWCMQYSNITFFITTGKMLLAFPQFYCPNRFCDKL